MKWGKLLERSGLGVCEDAPSGRIESSEQVATAQQIAADRREQLRNLGPKIISTVSG